ncbi:MAG: hypothetical protein M3R59_11040 [Verrucomicrobiota bacterium]|nr:hypothetical protein [Verrucomicrobiota bacterium]MDQ2924973.1 hypothetical protein [Acidobacteriota bacterium]
MRSLVIFGLLALAAVTSGDEPGFRYSAISGADRTQFASRVTDEALAKAPVWSPDAGAPPLTPRGAQQIAFRQLSQSVKDPKQWDLQEIGLVDTGDHLHWIYVVHYMRHYPDDMAVFGADLFNIVVLMDGTSIKPEVLHVESEAK